MFGLLSLTDHRTRGPLALSVLSVSRVQPIVLHDGPCTEILVHEEGALKDTYYAQQSYDIVLSLIRDSLPLFSPDTAYVSSYLIPSPMKGFITLSLAQIKSPLTIALHVIGKVEPLLPEDVSHFSKLTLSFGSSGQEVYQVRENWQEIMDMIEAAQRPSK